jgi:DNA-binding CsgD family transcriptional regulator
VPVREAQLLEREAELDELVAALEDARAGLGRLVVLEGAAGIGKTRLLAAARETASRTGMEVLTARGTELERDFPFALVRQLFEPFLHAASEAERGELLDGAARLAGPVVGVEATKVGGTGAVVDPSFAILNGLYWLTSNLAESRPLLLAVDDAHWGDKPSLRFFRFLLPRLGELPVLLVVATRPSEPDAESGLVAELGFDPAAGVLRPAGLSVSAVAELVRAQLCRDAANEFCGACAEATGGNPFMLGELLRHLSATGSRGAAADAGYVREAAPATIGRAVLVRLARLPEGAGHLAVAVGVLGDGADPRSAGALAGLDGDAIAAAADVLAAAGILEPGRPLRFVHPLVRNAVYTDLPGAPKAAAHRKAARLLKAQGAEPERIAVHLLATDPEADAEVVETLGAAARRALDRAAPEAAVSYLRRALAEPPDPGTRRELLWSLTMASFRAADPGALDDLDQDALGELTAEPRLLMESAEQIGFRLYRLGRAQEGGELLERAIRAANEAGNPDLAMRFESSMIIWSHLPPAAAQARLDRYKHRIARDTPAERVWLATQAFTSAFAGESAAEAAELARRALDGGKLIREALGRVESAAPALAIAVLVRADQHDAAQAAVEHYVAEARARGAAPHLAGGATVRGVLAFARGEIARAEPDARAAVETGRQGGFLRMWPPWIAVLIDVLVERGALDAAQQELEASGMDGEVPDDFWFGSMLHSRACLRLAQGRTGEGLEDVFELGRRTQRYGSSGAVTWFPTAAVAAIALAGLGQRDPARALAEMYMERAKVWGTSSVIGIGMRCLGVVEGGEQGIALLREAVATLERSPARLEYAKALTDLGAALRRTNRRAEAREPLRAALEIARHGGALAVARRAHEELEATGEKLRPLLASGIESLTPSERRVAEMAADGMQNREIAQALFLTLKTIESHLSNAYRKLDIRSRAQLPQALTS